MSVNTVRKYVAELEDRGLIVTESTSVTTRDGRKHNGTLRYTILPIQNAVDLHNQQQLRRLEETAERMHTCRKLDAGKKHKTGSPPEPSGAGPVRRGGTAQ